MSEEKWKPIPVAGFVGYFVSNLGRGLGRSNKILKLTTNKNGYKYLTVRCKNKMLKIYIHRAVWLAFVGVLPEWLTIHHIDHDKKNNHLENLELIALDEHGEETRAYNNDEVPF